VYNLAEIVYNISMVHIFVTGKTFANTFFQGVAGKLESWAHAPYQPHIRFGADT
jgi:hypothetical protein